MACVHRWNCNVTPAKCRYCGDERVFQDNPPVWNGDYEQSKAGYEARHAIRTSKRYEVES
jgi:hypothetical protein